MNPFNLLKLVRDIDIDITVILLFLLIINIIVISKDISVFFSSTYIFISSCIFYFVYKTESITIILPCDHEGISTLISWKKFIITLGPNTNLQAEIPNTRTMLWYWYVGLYEAVSV